MKIRNNLIWSVLKRTLFLFLLLFVPITITARPLTYSIYTVPEGDIDITIYEKFYTIDSSYRVDQIKFGLGLLTDLSLFFTVDYLHNGFIDYNQSEMGDSNLSLWYYWGDYCNDRLSLGFLLSLRIPTGRDVYTNSQWRNLAFGNNEIKIGSVMQFLVHKNVALTGNVFYVFREQENEDMYSGFYLNPFEIDTYTNVLGLNPFSEDSFLSYNKLTNDYVQLVFSAQTDVVFPIVIYTEFYSSFRFYRGVIDNGSLPIEGARYDIVLMSSLGVRYFISNSLHIGFFGAISLIQYDHYIKNIFGIECNIQF